MRLAAPPPLDAHKGHRLLPRLCWRLPPPAARQHALPAGRAGRGRASEMVGVGSFIASYLIWMAAFQQHAGASAACQQHAGVMPTAQPEGAGCVHTHHTLAGAINID